MRELLELQSGQVAFISGLMSGFSLSIAAHVLRYGLRSRVAQIVFLLFLMSSLMFLLALYVDVRLSIELAGLDTLPENLLNSVTSVRNVGTSSATFALCVFIVATGLLGWVATPATGVVSTMLALIIFYLLWYVWDGINAISLLIGKL
ncbi:MAG: hypothetical protein AB8B79_17605 [Granulosicoccus sp.]